METSLKVGNCIEFIYNAPQRTRDSSEAGAVAREYGRLLFGSTGQRSGEVVLGLDGRYMSGTYKMGTKERLY